MKALIQRVRKASVEVDSQVIASINAGMLVFVGIDAHDDDASVDTLSDRLLKYRLFADNNGKMNLNIQQADGDILMVSQFTLSADTGKGLRPGFSNAAAPEPARCLFERSVLRVKSQYPCVQTGQFGADMQVALVNDGPITFLLNN